MDMDTRTKLCGICAQEKPASEFYVRSNPGRTLSAYCKPCHSQRSIANERVRFGRTARVIEALPDGTKRCGDCKGILPLSAFPRRSDYPDRARAICNDCKRKQGEAYRQAHREQTRRRAAEYRARIGGEVLTDRVRQSIAAKPDLYREMHSQWKREHKDKVNASTHRRRSTLEGQASFTADEWAALKALYEHRCLMCGKREPEITLTVDHVRPLSRGGPNTIDNVQPLCRPCNSTKHRNELDLRGGQ